MFEEWRLKKGVPAYLQLKDYLKELILEGVLAPGVKLPSTREVSRLAGVSRNTVILAYQYLEDDGLLQTVRGRGPSSRDHHRPRRRRHPDWTELLTDYAVIATELDIEKKEARWQGMISLRVSLPTRSFLRTRSLKGLFAPFRPGRKETLELRVCPGLPGPPGLSPQLPERKRGPHGRKDLLITNGFTEAFDLTLTALTKPGAQIICENPTHNTAIKIMRLHGLEVTGCPWKRTGSTWRNWKRFPAGGDAAAVFHPLLP